MRRRWHLLAILAGSGLAFLADYPPARDAIAGRLGAIVAELREELQYREAIERTLDSIRRLPETEER